MRTAKLITLLACCLVGAQAYSASPSFKCSKDTHEIEALICQNDELAKLDVEMSKLYQRVLKATPASGQKSLKTEQISWVKGKNDCWKDSDQVGCTRQSYQERMKELKEKLGQSDTSAGTAKPAKFKDLVGKSSFIGIDRMRERGFGSVDYFETGNTQYNIFYNSKTHQCVQLTLANAKVESADDIKTHDKCH
jgi:uncharacterized protein